MNIDEASRSVLILDDEEKYAIDLQGILLAEQFSEVFTFHDNIVADRWLSRCTPDVAIIDPRLRDGSCRNAVATLEQRGVPYIVYSELRPGPGSWLSNGHWVSKPCIPRVMLAAVKSAVRLRNDRPGSRPAPSANPAQLSPTYSGHRNYGPIS